MTTATGKRTALVKERVWPSCGYEPHEGQALIHNSRVRHRLASCGRRFGKSKTGGMELVPEAMYSYLMRSVLVQQNLQRRFWIVGPNYDDAEREWRVFYDACKRLKFPFDRPGTYNDERSGNMQMSLWDHRFIVQCKSAEHDESLDGEGLDGVLMVEAAKMKARIWNKFIRPALADKRGWSLHTSTPEGKNHFYDFWRRGQDPLDLDWESWRMPSWANSVVFPGGVVDPEILDMAKDMTAESYNQEIGASFTDYVGRVFKLWDEETHVTDLAYDPELPLYACADYGWTNPFVWLLLQVDVWDNVYVLAEYRRTQMDVSEIAKELLTWKGGISKNVRTFYPDPSEPGDTNQLANALRIRSNTNTGGPLKDRLDMIRKHLKMFPEQAPDGWPEDRPFEQSPRLLVDRSCVDLIGEMDAYRYPETKKEQREAPELPMKKDDHGPEALGRFFRGHYGDLTAQSRTTRVSTASMA